MYSLYLEIIYYQWKMTNFQVILRRSTSRRYNWPARRLNVAVKAVLDFKINLVEVAEITLAFSLSSLR